MEISSNSKQPQGAAVQSCGARSTRTARREILSAGLVRFMSPLGLFSLMTGLFWIGDHGNYSKLFYWLVALPTLLLIALSAQSVVGLLRSRIFLAYLAFAVYMAVTLFWAEGEGSVIASAKRPLLVCILFISVFEFGQRRFDLLWATVKWSTVSAAVAAVVTVGAHYAGGGIGRLRGYGALNNPLLVSHVFGFFSALLWGYYFSARKLLDPASLSALLIFLILLFLTGARTPLVATVATVLWLSILSGGKKAVLAIGGLIVTGGMIWLFFPEAITQRGLSYRTEIWTDIVFQTSRKLWFGYGFSTPLAIWIEDLHTTFSDPHNLTLGVLYAGGVVGVGCWLFMYAIALNEAWRWRRNRWVQTFSATVVYGFVAGMTEGGAFLSRPKEHWFLIWIPLALLSLVTFRARVDE